MRLRIGRIGSQIPGGKPPRTMMLDDLPHVAKHGRIPESEPLEISLSDREK